MGKVKVKWINWSGQQQERIFPQKAAEKWVKQLEVAGLKVVSTEKQACESSNLRNKLIRLAHEKPELREHILPLLKEANTEGIKEGDIWSSSWGYNQTNVDFYQVARVTAKAVTLIQIDKKLVRSTGHYDYYTPLKGSALPDGKTYRRKVNWYREEPYAKLENYSQGPVARPWNGKALEQTGMGGH